MNNDPTCFDLEVQAVHSFLGTPRSYPSSDTFLCTSHPYTCLIHDKKLHDLTTTHRPYWACSYTTLGNYKAIISDAFYQH